MSAFYNLMIFISCLFLLDLVVLVENKVDDTWWGPNELKCENDTSVRCFRVQFSEEMICDLKYRLRNNRPPKPTLQNVGFTYGFNTRELPGWLKYWRDEYPFQQQEEFLNQYPQYKTNIQGLEIHFLRVTPKVPAGVEVVPLLLLHGWPGSVREFYEAIPLLTAVSPDRDFAIEVIAPSLPGFGFSDAAVRPGLAPDDIAVILRNLMHRLGYDKFYVQGGDWGAIIGAALATLYQNEVLGYHTNFALASPQEFIFQALGVPTPLVAPAAQMPSRDQALARLEETGYLHIQATKPDTVGVGLSDSPAGLLAYILQQFSSGTRPFYKFREDGGLDHYPRVTLLDNLMIYWVSGSISTSVRIYKESLNERSATGSAPTKVPTWAIQARYEIAYQPPAVLRKKYLNLLHVTVVDDGGHFFALEKPRLFADDVLAAVQEFRAWHERNSNASVAYW